MSALLAGGCATLPAGAEPGLWFGSIHACRDTVKGAIVSRDPYGGGPMLTVTFKPAIRAELERYTEERVGLEMPVTLDGKVIARPFLAEPIRGGAAAIHGPLRRELRRIMRASRGKC
jgi:preprotein translocase subunit SecD